MTLSRPHMQNSQYLHVLSTGVRNLSTAYSEIELVDLFHSTAESRVLPVQGVELSVQPHALRQREGPSLPLLVLHSLLREKIASFP
jgi:hypothetical protein